MVINMKNAEILLFLYFFYDNFIRQGGFGVYLNTNKKGVIL